MYQNDDTPSLLLLGLNIEALDEILRPWILYSERL